MTRMTHTEFSSADRSAFVLAMRGVANSVAVVTTSGRAGCHGATVSSFSSVSADPPMVLVCLRSGSRIAEGVARNGAVCINVLPQDRQDLANRFAGRDDHWIADRFEGVEVEAVPGAAPEIVTATVFSGFVDHTVTAGSHLVFICQVNRVRQGGAAPLAYLDGAYHDGVPQISTSSDGAIAEEDTRNG